MKILFSFVLLFFFFSCSYSKREGVELINVESSLTGIEKITVNDLGNQVLYIPLETTDESLLGGRAYVKAFNDKLLVASFGQPIKMFDKESGRYIKNIGDIGQGVNEYALQDGMPVFWIDESVGSIYIQTTGNNILRFDFDGDFLDRICLPDSFPQIDTITKLALNNRLYAYKQTLFNKHDYKIFSYDIKYGNIKGCIINDDEIIKPDFTQNPLFLAGFGNIAVSTCCQIFTLKNGKMVIYYKENPCMWNYENKIYFKENYNDTIYGFDEEKLIPRFVFNLGSYHCLYKNRFTVEGSEDKIFINYVLEGSNILIFSFQMNYYDLQNSKTYLGIYDKVNKIVKVTDENKIEDSVNEILINMPQSATSDGQLIGLIDAFSFIENDDLRSKFNVLEEDNPVVVIIK